MTSRDFCFWLQGYLELADEPGTTSALDERKVETIKKHLALAFIHDIDPSMGDADTQAKLNAHHNALGGPPKMRC